MIEEGEYYLLPWNGTAGDVDQWLEHHGYGSLIGTLTVSSGQELYKMDRDELRDICGGRDGVRIYSQLQKDRPEAAKRAGSSDNQSELQKRLGQRKNKTDAVMKAANAFKQGLHKIDEEDDDPELAAMPQWKRELIKKQRKGRDESPPPNERKGHRHSNRRNRDSSEDERDKKKGHRRNRRRDDDSDEDTKKRKGRSEVKKNDGKQSKKNTSKRDTYEEDIKGKKGKKSEHKKNDKKGKKVPTNIDDYSSNSETETSQTETESSTEEEYSTDNEERNKAAQLAGGAWALGEGDTLDNLDTRIRDQQLTIQQELSNLTHLQRDIGLKTLPSLQQKVLQADLSKLQDLQLRLKDTPGHRELQVQLVGQQMMLTEHLREIQESLSHKLPDVETHLENLTQRKLSHSASTSSIPPIPAQQPVTQQPMTQQPVTQQPMIQQPMIQQPMMQQPMTQPAMMQPLVQPMTQPLVQPIVHQSYGQPMTSSLSQSLYLHDPLTSQMAAAQQQQQMFMRQQLAASEYQRQLQAERNRYMMFNGVMSGYSPLTPSIPFM